MHSVHKAFGVRHEMSHYRTSAYQWTLKITYSVCPITKTVLSNLPGEAASKNERLRVKVPSAAPTTRHSSGHGCIDGYLHFTKKSFVLCLFSLISRFLLLPEQLNHSKLLLCTTYRFICNFLSMGTGDVTSP